MQTTSTANTQYISLDGADNTLQFVDIPGERPN